ncbi:hypothetical protein V6N12_063816 [Hibiscus sabdariffa]|uniref:Secreted protein n=1 Tax=Hibiscus sabdariffa TaxID=183260 RepID=A0ABR1ZHF5_9ROSI
MHFPLSWRWPRWWWVCYTWCTSRIPFGAALRFSVSQGGASLVRLASSTRDRFGSPRLELGSLLPRLGFHPKSEGDSIGDLGKWLSLGSPQCPACFYTAGALFVAFCGARSQPSLEECAGRCLGLFSLRYAPMLPLNASTLARCCASAQPSRQALGCALLAASRTTPMVPLCRGQGARFVG